MSDPILLTDEAMQNFIREGYVTVRSALPKAYHDAMYARLEPLEEDGLVGHNNLLPMVPELSELLDEPVVRGALTSILGPDYYLHFHRHDHVNHPEKVQPMQAWHLGATAGCTRTVNAMRITWWTDADTTRRVL